MINFKYGCLPILGFSHGKILILAVVWIWVLCSYCDVVLAFIELREVDIGDLFYDHFLC